jgi:hypothetical protein
MSNPSPISDHSVQLPPRTEMWDNSDPLNPQPLSYPTCGLCGEAYSYSRFLSMATGHFVWAWVKPAKVPRGCRHNAPPAWGGQLDRMTDIVGVPPTAQGGPRRYVVQKAPGIGGSPIPPDEPCLVIRGQDSLAMLMMAYYREMYEELPDANDAVIVELAKHQLALRDWQEANPGKIKVADR